MSTAPSENALEQRARRAAKRAGYEAHKTRSHAGTEFNRGRFAIFDPVERCVVAGPRFEMTAEQVIEWAAMPRARLTAAQARAWLFDAVVNAD
jgi:hypothetical protein